MRDTYFTLLENGEGEYKEKGSKFLSYGFTIFDETDFQSKLDVLKKQHPKARHFCYAWRLGTEGENFRANDDGEPSRTAGKPILNQIIASNLTFTAVVVVRYFGGTLLGTGGLIVAYRESTAIALSEAKTIERIVTQKIEIKSSYADMPSILSALKKLNIEIDKQIFEESCSWQIEIPMNSVSEILLKLKAEIFKVDTQYAAQKDWGEIEVLINGELVR